MTFAEPESPEPFKEKQRSIPFLRAIMSVLEPFTVRRIWTRVHEASAFTRFLHTSAYRRSSRSGLQPSYQYLTRNASC